MSRYFVPKFADLLFVCIFGGCLMVGSRMLNMDSDLGRHLVLGNVVWRTGTIPVNDVLSFTRAGDPRPPYEWLAQVLLAAANALLGLDGVVVFCSVVIAGAFVVVFSDAARRTGAPVLSLLISTWAALASSLHWLTRPHVLSFLFLAVWMRALERLRAGRHDSVWWLPILMLIWANTHGGFILGFMAWAAYAAGWLWDRLRGAGPILRGSDLLLAGGGSLVASIVTPDLWHNWGAVLQNRSLYLLGRTLETRPTDFSLIASWPFLGLLGLSAILAVANRGRLAAAHVFLLVGFAALGIGIARNVPYFCIVSAPLIATMLAQVIGKRMQWFDAEDAFARIDSTLHPYVWPLLVVLFALAWFGLTPIGKSGSYFAFDPGRYPAQAADWIESHELPGQMFNDINWGGYLLYRLWPTQRVFIDSQTDFYGESFTRGYEQAALGRGDWNAYLRNHAVSWMVIPTPSTLARLAEGDPNWRRLYDDPTASVFVREDHP